MKIGILTLHEANSFGAVLQAYALQNVLADLGADAKLVSFIRKDKEQPRKTVAGPLGARIEKAAAVRSERFKSFREQRLNCAIPIAWDNAATISDAYDAFIAGSDQVWNFRISEVDERYFLTFAPEGKRFSYAASFGGESVPEKLRPWCADAIGSFQELSVREESGREEIRSLTGRDSCVCIDPVLLADKSLWDKMEPIDTQKPYVFLFLLQYDAELHGAALAYAKERGLELKVSTAGFIPKFGFDAWSGYGPEDWLKSIRGAECVFTNSFHGAAFSLVFGRTLRVAPLSGDLAGRSGRIIELLRLAGLENALQEPGRAADGELERRIADSRDASMEYLERIVLK